MNQQQAQKPPAQPTFLGRCVGLALGAVLGFFASIVFGCIIEWVGMHSWWKAEGVQHSKNMVAEDLGYLKEYRRSVITNDTVVFAQSWADVVTKGASAIGYLTLLKMSQSALPVGAGRIQSLVHQRVQGLSPYIESGLYVAQDAAIRVSVIVLALPAFALATLLGLVDGLARRDIRKWTGGRESNFYTDKGLKLIWPLSTGGFTLYLTWPTGGFNPAWVVLPFCALLAFILSVMVANIRKYI